MSVRTMYRIHGDEIDFVVVEIPDHYGFRIRQLNMPEVEKQNRFIFFVLCVIIWIIILK